MPLTLPFVAESLFAAMVNQRRERFFSLPGLRELADMDYLSRTSEIEIAWPEARLATYGDRAFDGASRIDVLVRIGPSTAAAFELKLGTTRLTKTRVEDEWLTCCEPSHDGRRWKGNMMATLDRRFKEVVDGELEAITGDGTRPAIAAKWFLVVRQQTKSAWERGEAPTFTNAEIVAFEHVVRTCIDREGFNALVRGMLPRDFYQTWVGD